MELGNFLGKLKGEGKTTPKQFLALELTDQVVQAAVWTVEDGKTEIVALGTPVEWDGETGTTNELITAVDATISGATEGLESEPEEMVIGVAHSWADANGILGVKRELIKAICKELELKALGFVVITDSILRYLKMQEGTPATSILIQVSRDEVVLVLVRLGRIEATEVVSRSDDLVADVEEGMTRFPTGDHLPSRIIVEPGLSSGEELVQTLVSNDWQNKFNFLHIPKIEVLQRDIAISAIALAGGSEVAKAIGFAITEPNEQKPAPVQEAVIEETDVESVDKEIESNIIEQKIEPELEEEQNKEPSIISAQDAGFTIGGSLSASDLITKEDDPQSASPPDRPKRKISMPSMPKITLPKLALPNISLPKKMPVVIAAVVLLLAGLIFSFVWLMPKAEVTLTFASKPLEEVVELTLSTDVSTLDTDTRVIPALETKERVSGEKIIETTGKKTIGDPASGEVTIYNRTSQSKTFTKGTVLTAGTLKFTLDSDVAVASKSAGSDYVDVPGKATTKVTASAIGEAGNLDAGTEFTIGSFAKDTYVAKNDKDLTGGNSKEIQAVSQDDMDTLVDELTKELTETARAQVETEAGDGEGYYILQSDTRVVSDTYSNKVGDEASSLKGNIEIEVSILRYQKNDVTSLVSNILSQKIPDGYTRLNTSPVVELQSGTENDSGDIITSAKVTIYLIPTIDNATLVQSLRGKKSSDVETILTTFPGLTGADVVITPAWIPPRLKVMPNNVKNISITVQSSL